VESPLVGVFEYPAFAVQSLALYRTSILLIIQQITLKIPAPPGTSFMFHYAAASAASIDDGLAGIH
jgi:hypothetical protein